MRRWASLLLSLCLALSGASAAHGATSVVFREVASESGITYQHLPAQINVAMKTWGAPGVAIFDANGDDVPDLYVTNGGQAGNSLYVGHLTADERLTYTDQASQAGVALKGQISSGECDGDLFNTGHEDLLVLGVRTPDHLFRNRGNGTFEDITASSDINAGRGHGASAWSCTVGDVNNDGWLDIFIGADHDRGEPNRLLFNQHDGTFRNASTESGTLDIIDAVAPNAHPAAATWAVALVDYDLDGAPDLFIANDQPLSDLAQPTALINVYHNDGLGHFTNVTRQVGLVGSPGFWMGLAFGDFNGDRRLDFFATNFGDYFPALLNSQHRAGSLSSRWFLADAKGRFTDPGPGALVTVPFGWGAVVADYNNDGFSDILFAGGLDMGPYIDMSNAGAVLQGDGAGHFTRDENVLPISAWRDVQGVATGDLNNDGFPDFVTVSDFNLSPGSASTPYPTRFGSPFDHDATYLARLKSAMLPLDPGTLAVYLNSADNGNGWISIRLIGNPQAHVNRDGIGAVLIFTPDGGQPAMQPILGGASYASEQSLVAHLGLGAAAYGTLDILWPGGTWNRLYQVARSERLTFPVIPCDFKKTWASLDEYVACVTSSLDTLSLEPSARVRFLSSALRAYQETHP